MAGRPRGPLGLTEQFRETLAARNEWLLEGAIPLAEKTRYLQAEQSEHKHFQMFIRAGDERWCCVCGGECLTNSFVILSRHCLTEAPRRGEFEEVCCM